MDIYTATELAYKNGYAAAKEKNDTYPHENNQDILRFISAFAPIKDNLLYGFCYWFANILHERFGATTYYDVENNHFVGKINGRYYDASGETTGNYIPWYKYRDTDPEHFAHIVRDCIELKN